MAPIRPICLILALAFASPAGAAGLVRGPYLQQLCDRSVIVVFDLDGEHVAEVRYGQGSGDLDQSASAAAAAIHHEIELNGLEAATGYGYGVFVDGEELTADLSFTTAPDADGSFTFLLYGDTRSGHDEHEDVVGVMTDDDALILVHTGDLVASGDQADQWDTFFSIEQPLIQHMALFPVVGNHDEEDGEALLYEDAFALPGNELYYSFDIANAHFVMLDQHVNTVLACAVDELLVDNCLDEEQVAWLEADLAEAKANPDIDLIFVVAHSGPYSSKDGRAGSMHLRVLMPLFAAHGVTAFLSGHDHYYERGLCENGIPYVISGGGGAGLYDIGDPSDDPHTVIFNDSVNHFVVVEVSGTVVRFAAKTLDGVIMDEVVFDATDLVPPVGDDDDDDDDATGGSGPGVPLSEASACACSASPAGAALALPLAAALGLALRRRTR